MKQHALEAGFDLVGIAPIAAWQDLKFSRQWVERGYGGEMRYLENPKRDDPRRILPSAKSVVCVGLVYNTRYPYSIEVSRHKAGIEIRKSKFENRNSGNPKPKTCAEPVRPPLANGSERSEEAQGKLRERIQNLKSRRVSDARAWISRYAWGTDYHRVMRERLENLRAAIEGLSPGVETRVYVDTGPIVERAFARLSGIGWMGKNTCLINEGKGSWFFLGVILTSLELLPDLPAPDRCGSCTRCIEACPTGALPEPYVMDASRCIAYLTIELKGSIASQFRSAIGANIFGCDICQDVCPWNGKSRSQEPGARSQNGDQPSAVWNQRRSAAITPIAEFQPAQLRLDHSAQEPDARHSNPETPEFTLFNPPLEALASLTEEDFRRIFRDSPIKRTKYRGWLRNLCVAMGNSGDERLLPHLKRLTEDADPVVREHAEWAVRQVSKVKPLARKPSELQPEIIPAR